MRGDPRSPCMRAVVLDKYMHEGESRMRVEEIIGVDVGPRDAVMAATDVNGEFGLKRNTRFPEVAKLLNARVANAVFGNESLARDEMELANFIINKLDVDPHYVPGEAVLQAIRVINAKLSAR